MKKDILKTRSNEIEYTSGQLEALAKVKAFLDNPEETFFLLAGYSGTGKTTIAENIIGYKRGSIAAPTNAAVNRLKSKINMPFNDHGTIHKILFSPTDDNGKFRKDKSFVYGELYIIDECSMIDKYILDIIIKDAIEKKNKIIFMGDSYQLEPVGKNPHIFKWENSYPEFFKDYNRYELTEVRRYDGDLLKIATDLRSRKDSSFKKFETDEFNEVMKFSTNLVKDLTTGKNFVVITSTNSARVMYNKKLRQYKYRNDDTDLKVVQKDDILVSVSNSNYYANGEIISSAGLSLLEKFTIQVPMDIEVDDWKSYECLLYKKRTFENLKPVTKMILVIPELLEPTFNGPTIVTSVKHSKTILSPMVKSILIFSWYNKLKMQNEMSFNRDVSIATYGYAISGHKAQGQEWDNVYIDGQWMSDKWDTGKWYYTAITRAKKKVEVKVNPYLHIVEED